MVKQRLKDFMKESGEVQQQNGRWERSSVPGGCGKKTVFLVKCRNTLVNGDTQGGWGTEMDSKSLLFIGVWKKHSIRIRTEIYPRIYYTSDIYKIDNEKILFIYELWNIYQFQ